MRWAVLPQQNGSICRGHLRSVAGSGAVLDVRSDFGSERTGHPRLQQFAPVDLPQIKDRSTDYVPVTQSNPSEERRRILLLQRIQRAAQMIFEVFPAVVTATGEGKELPSEGRNPPFVPGRELVGRLATTQGKVPGKQGGQLRWQAG